MGFGTYLTRRLLLMIPVLLGVTFITFAISRVMVPNPVAAWAGRNPSPATLAALTNQFHLHDNLLVQYWYYLNDLVRGNWGVSPVADLPVLTLIEDFFPATIELAIVALILSVAMGIPMGVLSAIWKGKKLDYPIRVFYLSGVASPSFFLALILQLVFGYYLRILPISGRFSPTLTPPPHVTGMYLVDSLLAGNWVFFLSALEHIILPATALALLAFAFITRVTRTSMLETLKQDFVRTARAKGLPNRTVTFRHVLRNALTSTVTIVGLVIQYLLTGTVVVETIFFWPGVGSFAARSVLSIDFPSIMGVTVVFTLVVVVTNLITDMAYAVLDPRVVLQ